MSWHVIFLCCKSLPYKFLFNCWLIAESRELQELQTWGQRELKLGDSSCVLRNIRKLFSERASGCLCCIYVYSELNDDYVIVNSSVKPGFQTAFMLQRAREHSGDPTLLSWTPRFCRRSWLLRGFIALWSTLELLPLLWLLQKLWVLWVLWRALENIQVLLMFASYHHDSRPPSLWWLTHISLIRKTFISKRC